MSKNNVTQVLPPFAFYLKFVKVARLVCLQNKVCWHSLTRHRFKKLHLAINRWLTMCKRYPLDNAIPPVLISYKAWLRNDHINRFQLLAVLTLILFLVANVNVFSITFSCLSSSQKSAVTLERSNEQMLKNLVLVTKK